ncbi:uncharacterized protein METZ01_LOCUS473617, partial [marine metagenome]
MAQPIFDIFAPVQTALALSHPELIAALNPYTQTGG